MIAGFIGAIAMNALHEIFRKTDDEAPRINEVAEEALDKSLHALHIPEVKSEDNKYFAALTGDLLSNAMYYATTVTGTGTISGLIAGLAAIYLPSKFGLDDEPVAGTNKKKAMTIGYYLAGAVVTSVAYKLLRSKNH